MKFYSFLKKWKAKKKLCFLMLFLWFSFHGFHHFGGNFLVSHFGLFAWFQEESLFGLVSFRLSCFGIFFVQRSSCLGLSLLFYQSDQTNPIKKLIFLPLWVVLGFAFIIGSFCISCTVKDSNIFDSFWSVWRVILKRKNKIFLFLVAL